MNAYQAHLYFTVFRFAFLKRELVVLGCRNLMLFTEERLAQEYIDKIRGNIRNEDGERLI